MFELDPLHWALAGIGLALIGAHWLPRFFSSREPAATPVLIALGTLLFGFVSPIRAHIDPVANPDLWKIITELCVVIGLFGVGLRIDRPDRVQRWRTPVMLLCITMPLTIIALVALGLTLAQMSLAGAVLLGAVLAPTDPVLAGDVQVGPPLEGGEHPVRFALTGEAGLNDGLAFPFVHLGILLAAAGGATISWELTGEWLLRDVVYRIIAGTAGGIVSGYLLAKMVFVWPRGNTLSETKAGIVGLAGALFAYGITELVDGYGFIAAFVAGLMIRQFEESDSFHRKLHDFSGTVEHALTALVLIGVGAVLPVLWEVMVWQHVAIAFALVMVIRPLAGWAATARQSLEVRDRLFVAFFGVRGVGSLFYLAYAAYSVRLEDADALWSITLLTICLSCLVHGLSAGGLVQRLKDQRDHTPT